MTIVGIIGLSRIVHGHPSGDDHMKAIGHYNGYIPVWDPDHARLQEVMHTRAGLSQMLRPEAVVASCDVLLIASPAECHFEQLEMAINVRGATTILCEKPLSYTYEQGARLCELAYKRGVNLLVNFQRRWAPGVQAWCDGAKRGEWGALDTHGDTNRAAGMSYKGPHTGERFSRDACHGLDLLAACGLESKDFDISVGSEFSVRAAYARSELWVREVTSFAPVWRNIFATLRGEEKFVCTAADCLPGMKLVDELCPK